MPPCFSGFISYVTALMRVQMLWIHQNRWLNWLLLHKSLSRVVLRTAQAKPGTISGRLRRVGGCSGHSMTMLCHHRSSSFFRRWWPRSPDGCREPPWCKQGLVEPQQWRNNFGESLHRSAFHYSSFRWLFLMRLCILRWEFHPRYGWGPVGCEGPFSTYAAPHRFGFLPMWAAAALASSPWVWSRKEMGWAPVTRQHAREHQWEPLADTGGLHHRAHLHRAGGSSHSVIRASSPCHAGGVSPFRQERSHSFFFAGTVSGSCCILTFPAPPVGTVKQSGWFTEHRNTCFIKRV